MNEGEISGGIENSRAVAVMCEYAQNWKKDRSCWTAL